VLFVPLHRLLCVFAAIGDVMNALNGHDEGSGFRRRGGDALTIDWTNAVELSSQID
jgi:hypothetical protein